MIRVLYFSTASADLDRSGVDAIVQHSSDKNSKIGVTGALAYNGRNFCQVLEGDEETVLALLKIIEQDPRHSGFKIIDQKQISSRHFPDWSMKRVRDLDFSTVINAMQD